MDTITIIFLIIEAFQDKRNKAKDIASYRINLYTYYKIKNGMKHITFHAVLTIVVN